MRTRIPSPASSARTGAVLMEFVLAMPLFLLLMFLCMQFAHMLLAKQVVKYAAFAAARAALVHCESEGGPSLSLDAAPRTRELPYSGLRRPYRRGLTRIDPGIPDGLARSEAEWAANQAAARVCSWIVMGGKDNPRSDTVFPGWGRIPGSNAAARKTRADVRFENWTLKVRVEHDFGLIFPVAGPVIGWWVNPWADQGAWGEQRKDDTQNVHRTLDAVGYPHVRFLETVDMPKPYRTMIPVGNYGGVR